MDHDDRPDSPHLAALLAVAATRPRAGLWLDLKNLTPANSEAALACLEALVTHFSLARGRIIVESSSLEALALFADAGYLTSWSVTLPHGASPAHLTGLCVRLAASRVAAVSANLANHDLVAALFPHEAWLLWDLKSIRRQPLKQAASLLRRHVLLADPRVKVLLVDERHLRR